MFMLIIIQVLFAQLSHIQVLYFPVVFVVISLVLALSAWLWVVITSWF